MKSISIVMPALNEEEGITETIKSIPLSYLKKQGYAVEILVIDGGSTDKTVENAQKAGATVVKSPRGYGKQYKVGFKRARGDIIITGDSDGTYPFEEIPSYVEIFEKHSLDFITVNRFAHLQKGAMHWSNRAGNFGLTIFTNVLFGFKIKDSQSGMWLIRRSSLKKLHVASDGMPFSQELKIEAFSKVKSKEIPGFYKRRFGATKLSKIKDGLGNLGWLFKKRLIHTPSEYRLG